MSYAQYLRLHVHVGASNRTVVRKAHRMLAKHVRRDPLHRSDRHAWLRGILQEHADAREEYLHYRF